MHGMIWNFTKDDDISYESNRNNPIPPMQQLLLTLRFFATGGFYMTVGDFGRIHKSTICKIVHKVTGSLASLRPQFIKMPQSAEEKVFVQKKFMEIARFPRVIGAIDCTHIRIDSPGGTNAEVFRNRKGYFSLNVQAISDADYKFQYIVTRWPGSAHDSNIFDNSTIKNRFDVNEFGHTVLLGDSGYALRKYMVTPIQNPRGEAENLFNESQIRTRGIIERTFGIWKRRFPCLSNGLRCRLPLAQNIIVATAVVHNIARGDTQNENLESFPKYVEEDQESVVSTDSPQ